MKKKSLPIIVAGLVLFATQGFINRVITYPHWKDEYSVKTGDLSSLDAQQLLASLAGFREMIAGILWVRADSFFDEGNYDAILPIIRLVTILDPKEIDVYSTGMWHIAYNFTDEESRSDRRYVPSALALGAEGAANNKETYELFFETGWLWYHKIDDDYENTVKWWEEAQKRPDMQTARKNILAQAYLRNGDPEKAAALFKKLLDDAEVKMKTEKDFQAHQNRDTIETNYDNLLVRMGQRGYWALKNGTYDQGDYDTKPPFDVNFSAQVTVEDPKVIRVEGSYGVFPVGTRIRIILRDKNYPDGKPAGMKWDNNSGVNLDPPRNLTWMQDGLFVKNQAFKKRIDMSRDPTMYPFDSKEYVIDFFYNPRSAPAHIQDKFGFSGEGFTDKNYLNTEIRPGQRVLFARLEISQDQILRRGEWAPGRKTPVLQTKGYVAPSAGASLNDILVVPGLRTEKGGKK